MITVKPPRPRGAVYVMAMHANAGTIAFAIRRDRATRGYGSEIDRHTVYAWRDGMVEPQVLHRTTQVFIRDKECGRGVTSVHAGAGGLVTAVVTDSDHKVVDAKCVPGRRKTHTRLLAFSPGFPLRSYRLPHGLTYDEGDGIYPTFSANGSPDGLYFGGDTGKRVVYTRLTDGTMGSFAAPAGYRFLGVLFGPGGRVLATARKKNAVRVLYFPSLNSPETFFDLQSGRGDKGYRNSDLYGRFCGNRPVVVDSDRDGYTVYDDLGNGKLFFNGNPKSVQSLSVGCTPEALVTQLIDLNTDSERWTSIPIP